MTLRAPIKTDGIVTDSAPIRVGAERVSVPFEALLAVLRAPIKADGIVTDSAPIRFGAERVSVPFEALLAALTPS